MNLRLFIAIEITDLTREKIINFQNDLKKTSTDIKWVAPENLHITLKFIGATEEDKISDIITAINQSVSNIKPFNLCYRGAGAFPFGKNPRVIFARALDTHGILASIYKKLNLQLSTLGITYDERKFEAHVTVGRVKTHKNLKNFMNCIDSYEECTFGNETIDHLVLMKSELSREGPAYTKLSTISFV